MYPQAMFRANIKRKNKHSSLKNGIFTAVKYRCIFHWRVIVMILEDVDDSGYMTMTKSKHTNKRAT